MYIKRVLREQFTSYGIRGYCKIIKTESKQYMFAIYFTLSQQLFQFRNLLFKEKYRKKFPRIFKGRCPLIRATFSNIMQIKA